MRVFCFCFFSDRLLSALHGHSFFFIPATTANDLWLRRIFYPRFFPLHLFSYLNSWERASIFPFECSVLNKGTTGTIFITSLVWRGSWLGIEPGTSCTRSQHYTTRLSRRRYSRFMFCLTMSLLSTSKPRTQVYGNKDMRDLIFRSILSALSSSKN